jgi:hypothetical protein
VIRRLACLIWGHRTIVYVTPLGKVGAACLRCYGMHERSLPVDAVPATCAGRGLGSTFRFDEP